MHEVPVTQSILDIALRHAAGQRVRRIAVIHLRIGELSDLEDEWLQSYFEHLSRGTLAEQAKLAITRTPIVLRCRGCEHSFEVHREVLHDSNCPSCGEARCEFVSGREYVVASMEVM